ncbi:MAG: NAD(P)/FAD-dependent oxidoreductase [Cytophagales bacterium]|nr:NAD(P)/FAD-dependent oxidoreductase [Cytophagales bacterium]
MGAIKYPGMNKYDTIIIGGGHNGLTTAALLAKKGKKVVLLEKRNILGGMAAGEEFHPGYRTTGLLHDTSGVRQSVIKTLQLEKYGLKTNSERAAFVLLSKEGQGISISSNTKETAESIERFSKKDAAAYIEYRDFIDKISGFFGNLLQMPPDIEDLGPKQLWVLAKKGLALRLLGKRTMLELLRVAPMCVADFLNERFETDFLKAGIAAPAIYGSFTGPWSAGNTLNLLLWECTAKNNITGGPQALILALEKAAKDAGVEMRTDACVQKILLNQEGRVEGVEISGSGSSSKEKEVINAKVVAASCTPKETFLNLLASNEIEYRLENSIAHIRSRGTTAKVNLALNKMIRFKYGTAQYKNIGKEEKQGIKEIAEINEFEFIRTCNTLDEMEKAFDCVKYRTFSDELILDIHVPIVSNPQLAPEGHCVVSILVHFVPLNLDGGWTDEQRKKLGDKVIKCLEQYAPNVSESIAGREILSPVDLEERYGLTEGHIYHGEHAADQLITRPVPSCARYATPIPGLYLCGSGSHPGGGITCAPGALAAEAILKKL